MLRGAAGFRPEIEVESAEKRGQGSRAHRYFSEPSRTENRYSREVWGFWALPLIGLISFVKTLVLARTMLSDVNREIFEPKRVRLLIVAEVAALERLLSSWCFGAARADWHGTNSEGTGHALERNQA